MSRDSKNMSTDSKRVSTDSNIVSPDSRNMSSDSTDVSTDSWKMSTDSRKMSSDSNHVSAESKSVSTDSRVLTRHSKRLNAQARDGAAGAGLPKVEGGRFLRGPRPLGGDATAATRQRGPDPRDRLVTFYGLIRHTYIPSIEASGRQRVADGQYEQVGEVNETDRAHVHACGQGDEYGQEP
jgi:hypothetical protein